MKRYWKLFLVLPLLAISLSGCAITYSAEPIAARIVDAETKEPIGDVVVTANWQLEEGTMGGNVPVGQLMVMEAVTDKEGKFAFPGWGPKLAISNHLVNRDPQLLLFKNGYEYRGLVNTFVTNYNKGSLRRSEWNGKTIEMKKFKGADMQTHYKNLLNFSKEVDSFATWHIDPCQWTNLPIAINKMLQERKQLEAQGAHSVMDRTLDRQLLEGESYFIKQCGSTAQALIERMKK